MIPNSFRTLALSTALAVFAGGALAQTAPGTPVTNTIDLSYNSGGNTPTVSVPSAASVVFNVDRKIDVIVTAQAGSGIRAAVPGETVTWSYLVKNEGNGTQGFSLANTAEGNSDGTALSLTRITSTDPLDEGQYRVWVSPTNDIGDPAAQVYTDGTNAMDRAAGEEFYVIFEARVGVGATDGQNNVFQVVATVTTAGTETAAQQVRNAALDGTSTVWADAASTGAFTDVAASFAALDGNDGDNTQLLITAPNITATKTVAVLSENLPGQSFDCEAGGAALSGAAAAIPGACIEYTITVTNNSVATAAENISITDVIPANTTYVGVSTDNFTAVTESGGTVTATLASLAAGGATASFRIRATID